MWHCDTGLVGSKLVMAGVKAIIVVTVGRSVVHCCRLADVRFLLCLSFSILRPSMNS